MVSRMSGSLSKMPSSVINLEQMIVGQKKEKRLSDVWTSCQVDESLEEVEEGVKKKLKVREAIANLNRKQSNLRSKLNGSWNKQSPCSSDELKRQRGSSKGKWRNNRRKEMLNVDNNNEEDNDDEGGGGGGGGGGRVEEGDADCDASDGEKNSVSTFELFKYANRSEQMAVMLGLLLMWYAASWQPISVFRLAIMASLMGAYCKRTSWLLQILFDTGISEPVHLKQLQQHNQTSALKPTLNFNVAQTEHEKLTLINSFHQINGSTISFHSADGGDTAVSGSFLGPISSYLGPILEALLSSCFGAFNSSSAGLDKFISDDAKLMDEKDAADKLEIRRAVRDIFDHESRQFLRRSLEINGSALVLAISQLLAFFIGISLITWTARKQASRVKMLYFSSCLSQEASWFESERDSAASGSGSSLNALLDKYEDGIGVKLALLSFFLGHVALFALTAFYQQVNLATFCMPFVLVVCLIIGYLSEWQAVAIGREALFGKRSLQLAEEIVSAIKTVFAFNGQQKELTRYGLSLRIVYRKSLMKHLYTALNTSLSKFSIFACFSAYCFYAMRLFPPFDPIGPSSKSTVLAVMRGAEVSIVNILISIPFMEALQQSKGSIARVFAAIERKSSISSPGTPSKGQQSATDMRKRAVRLASNWLPTICFKSVKFGYAKRAANSTNIKRSLPVHNERKGTSASGGNSPTTASSAERATDECVLEDFSLDIQAGQSVALVGPSGSGKSTVLALIQRLYDINSGQLFVGSQNVEVRDLDVAWLRNQIGVVSQEPQLFDISIEENIRLGLSEESSSNDDDDDDDDEVENEKVKQQVLSASKAAGAHSFIERLPEGYATRVGSGGVQLSGGQKQRIAIARALIRKPKILLLDETTSALDMESEAHVQETLRDEAFKGTCRTTITVAHRLATIRHSHLIVVMSDGKVLEKGRHDELMSGCDLYRTMWNEQEAQQLSVVKDELLDEKIEDGDKLSSSILRSSEDAARSRAALEVSSLKANESQTIVHSSTREKERSGIREVKIERPTLAQLWRFIDVPKWSALAASLVCLIAGLILPMNLIAHSYLFRAFAYEELEQIGDYLHAFGLLILSFSSFVFIVSFLQIILPGYVGEKISSRLRAKTMESLLEKPVFYFDMDANSAGSLCNRFNAHISSIQSIAGSRIATVLEAISTLTVGAFYGFGQNFALSMFCLSFALLVLFTTIVESKIVANQTKIRQHFDSQLAHLMSDALQNIKTIASLNKESYFLTRFCSILKDRELRADGFWVNNLCNFLVSLKFLMPAISWSASMHYGSHLLVSGRIDLQTVFIVCPVVLFAVNDTFRALVFLPELVKARKSLEQIYLMNYEFSLGDTWLRSLSSSSCAHLPYALNCEPSVTSADSLQRTTNSTGSCRRATGEETHSHSDSRSSLSSQELVDKACGRIEFKGVVFDYPSRPGALVLDGLTFSIGAGESVALVGASGSGKSSCVALLEKFYDYRSGSITLDGYDLRSCDSHWVRDQLALVSQEPRLLSYSIADNIRYGDNSRFVHMDEVVKAARRANIHEFIMSLPEQYETRVSGSGSGSLLSGGQRQRIAIARALIRRAPIMIFDEATSALDAQNERLVQEALREARRGRSCLTIAHRLSTIKDADQILVLRDGRLIECGKHAELLARHFGHYKALWFRQQQCQQTSTDKSS